jgi:hypothetical protein
MEYQRTMQQRSFGERLANEAQRARETALTLPPGNKRDALLEKARLADLGARINGWLAATELDPACPRAAARPSR